MKPTEDEPARLSPPGRIGVVRNPRSHRNKMNPRAPTETDRLLIAEPASRERLAEVLGRFVAEKVDLLVVDGGDGTVHDVLTRGYEAFGEDWPRLMVMPKGKTNALAIDLDMSGQLTLEQAIARLPEARIERRRALKIERIGGSEPPVFGFILGSGVFNAAVDAAQVTHRWGAFQGFAVALTTIIGMTLTLLGIGGGPWRALWPTRIATADGNEAPHSPHGRPGERWVAGFSTLSAFPLGMHPFAGSGAEPCKSIACIVVDAPLRRVIARAPAILAGAGDAHYARLGIHRLASPVFDVEFGCRFVLDGESFPPGAYRISLGPQLEFLVP